MSVGFSHESPTNISKEWYTPSWIFDELGINFDIDVCSPEGGISWIPAKKYFTKTNCGLSQDWHGTVWCNPPYGRDTPVWLNKMSAHNNGVALVFARTDCAWYHDYVCKADAILFLRKRIKFVDGMGMTGNSGAGSGSMLVAWGQLSVNALQSMSDIGHLVLNSKGDV